jgi:beta-glucanase (GH16 family)
MKIRFLIFMAVIFMIASVSAYGQCRELVWSDEFDYSGLPDPARWSYETGGGGWGNNELEYYTSNRLENASVADGHLLITARKESYGGMQYTSARMVTKLKGDFLYGRIEARAKLPRGKGTWPAIWMMPTDGEYGGWPNSGEIDIMEHVGYDPNKVHATVHTASNYGANGRGSAYILNDVFDTYHIYAVEWTPQKMDFYVDDHLYFTVNATSDYKTWPFNKRFFLIMNVAVGGNWGGAQGVDDSVFPASMDVDYVRVYQGPENMNVKGSTQVYREQKNVRFFIEAEEGRTYEWTVPEDATIVSGQGTNEILVDWGCTDGQVKCHLGTACNTYDLPVNVTTQENSIEGPYFVTDQQAGVSLVLKGNANSTVNWTLPADAELVSGQGTDTLTFNWGTGMDTVKVSLDNTCGTYEYSHTLRHYGQYAYPDPAVPHEIPGIIHATDYDYGGEGVAYHDVTAGNAGTGPRSNESVDTEYSGSGTDVGWVDSGEWLEYSIKVPVAGTYHFSWYTASANAQGGGPAKIMVNDVNKFFLYPPSTGSWSVFLASTFKDLPLATTDTLLRIETGSGGFNIGDIRILAELPTGMNDHTGKELTVYPVPARGDVHVICPEGARSLVVTDLSGRIMYSSRASFRGPGEITVDFTEFPAGMYIVTLSDQNAKVSVRKIVK